KTLAPEVFEIGQIGCTCALTQTRLFPRRLLGGKLFVDRRCNVIDKAHIRVVDPVKSDSARLVCFGDIVVIRWRVANEERGETFASALCGRQLLQELSGEVLRLLHVWGRPDCDYEIPLGSAARDQIEIEVEAPAMQEIAADR